ncbi:hypothetical protein R1sor_011674 [Riccia sorocarpa]|uniref:Uncharacterized protein n=1 Tax=Riccia sorocarpa TaxID=122646 RepID=A0ABD3I1Y6_9MARC
MENQRERMKVLAREKGTTTAPQQPASTVPRQNPTANGNASTLTRRPATTVESNPKKTRHVPEKMFDISLTIGILGSDIKGDTFDKLANFLEARAEMGVTASIPVINLDRNEESGADLDRVHEALLSVGFAVGRKTD